MVFNYRTCSRPNQQLLELSTSPRMQSRARTSMEPTILRRKNSEFSWSLSDKDLSISKHSRELIPVVTAELTLWSSWHPERSLRNGSERWMIQKRNSDKLTVMVEVKSCSTNSVTGHAERTSTWMMIMMHEVEESYCECLMARINNND